MERRQDQNLPNYLASTWGMQQPLHVRSLLEGTSALCVHRVRTIQGFGLNPRPMDSLKMLLFWRPLGCAVTILKDL